MTTLKYVNVSQFFERVHPSLLKTLQCSEQLFQTFISQTSNAPFFSKLAIFDHYLIISQKKEDEMVSVLALELTEAIRFKRLIVPSKIKSKTPAISGLLIINDRQQILRLFFQYSAQLQQCILRLSTRLYRFGFEEEFRIIGKIGKGSTSGVFKIQQLTDGKMFTAKVFLKSFLEAMPQRKESVSNEISLLRSLDHRNLLKIHSVYESASALYVVTDLMQGGTLLERINASRGVKMSQVKQILAGIAEGLKYMHNLGVMHRDIKLENIMFRSKDSYEPVIIDFGLAAISDEEPYLFYRCGTPGYIAPEIIRMVGKQKINVGCDIFSAGVIFHVLLTNQFLFPGQNNQQVYSSNKSLSFDLRNSEYHQYDKEAMNLMSKMLSLSVVDRISAQQILNHPFLQDWQGLNNQIEAESLTISQQADLSYNI